MINRIIADISDYIFVSDKPTEADAVFLPGGSHPQQPEYAAELYHQGMARWMIPSGGVSVKLEKWAGVRSKAEIYNGDYQSDCEFFTDVLVKNGVPLSAIIGEDKSGHTRDNAFLSRKAADERGVEIKRALIVCKAFHARRCLMLYQMAFPEAEIKVCPVYCYNITKDNWYKSEKGIDRVLGELARCGNQFAGDIKEYCMKNCVTD
ncbi:MAG: YdcF family protein [Oscillospiraceae bacterium]|nr:YdcF family protein [Oscillospiraceae bacterium]